MKRTPGRAPAAENQADHVVVARDSNYEAVRRHKEASLVHLRASDAPRIARLDCESWPQPMRASETIIVRRFELGHRMLGIEHDSALLGVVAFSYTQWTPQAKGTFPTTNVQFNSQPHSEPYNCAFAYNLVTHPNVRGSSISRRLIAAGLAQLRRDGCEYLLGHSRCPSYNGSDVPGIEHFSASTVFRQAIDDAIRANTLPESGVLLLDPVLRFYHRALRCTFTRVMANFLPEDTASGGRAVRFVKQLQPADDGECE